MFIVTKRPTEPEWLPVIGGEILFAPIDRPLVRRARRSALKALGQDEHGPEPDGERGDVVALMEDLGDAFSFALILEGAIDWRGAVQAVDGGAFEPLPFSKEALADMLSDAVYFDAVDAVYVLPYAKREREKNGFAASPAGTGEAAMPGNDTASFPATPSGTDGAPPAPIVRRPRKARKPKASSRS